MPYVPQLEICMRGKCGEIHVTETRGAYHVTNNPTGWGTPNIQGSDVDEATLTILYPDGSETDHDLLSQIPSTVSGDIVFDEIEGDYEDGIYTFTFTLIAGSTTVTKVVKKLFLCNAQCCVDKMWAKIPVYIYTKNEKFLANYIDQVHYVQGLINGAHGAGGCLNTTAVNAIIEKIERICDFNTCQTCH